MPACCYASNALGANMDAIDLTETLIGREVERLFSENPAQSNGLCTNPVTGQ